MYLLLVWHQATAAFFVCLVFGMKFDISPETISSEGQQNVIQGVSKSGQWLGSNFITLAMGMFVSGPISSIVTTYLLVL
jgi:hypothetical protein